jgi:hypothetical protein
MQVMTFIYVDIEANRFVKVITGSCKAPKPLAIT